MVGVKGTNFDVTVGSGGTSVDVSEGVVEVDTPDGGDSATIVAGQSASVATQSGSTVTVTTSTTAGEPLPTVPSTKNSVANQGTGPARGGARIRRNKGRPIRSSPNGSPAVAGRKT